MGVINYYYQTGISVGTLILQNPAFRTFLLESTGAELALTSNNDAFDCDLANADVTIDGQLYSIDGAGAAVYGAQSYFAINGECEGAPQGVYIYSRGSDTLNIGAQGAVSGISEGVQISTVGSAMGGDTVDNGGRISGRNGVVCEYSYGDNSIDNQGDIAGTNFGVAFSDEQRTDSVDNTGQITGTQAAIDDRSGGAATITNAGDVTSDNLAIQLKATISAAEIDNTGRIAGTEAAIYEEGGGGVDIVNAGAITSNNTAIWLADTNRVAVEIDNTGQIIGDTAILAYADLLLISNVGTIQGNLEEDHGAFVDLDNSGHWIDQNGAGLVLDGGGGGQITNSGDIHAPIYLVQGAGSSLNNSGAIQGPISFRPAMAEANVSIHRTTSSSSGALINTGSISGAVSMAGAHSTLTNHGIIYGNLLLGANSTLTDTGLLDGGVTLGSDSTLTDTGRIDGSVKLGADDIVAVGDGGTIGAVDGLAGGDTFKFAGGFGHVSINFRASPNIRPKLAHDILQFSADEFASYAAVQGAMTQEGADVVITLDAKDTIVLDSVHLSALVAADFKFV